METTFINTYSIEQFKKLHDISEINIIKNPHTDKLFFTTDSEIRGTVSTKFEDLIKDEKSISECADENGEVFWMIHKKQKDNVVVSL